MSTAPFLYLADLDHTLFQTKRSDERGIKAMAVNTSGEDVSFARPDQVKLYDTMKNTGIVVPVTARSHIQMERVTGWSTSMAYDLAITDLGASLLLRDNNGDGQWQAIESWHEDYLDTLSERTPRLVRDFQLLKDTLIPESHYAQHVQVDLVAMGKLRLPFYIVISVNPQDGTELAPLMESLLKDFGTPFCRMAGMYRLHVTDNTICFWPDFVSKGIAVERLLGLIKNGCEDERLDRALTYLSLSDSTIVTLGDSTTDIEFMRHGHFMLTPQGSQVSQIIERHAAQAASPV